MIFDKLTAPKRESDIIKHWKFQDEIYVSIVCITFNQANYLRETIEGFLGQVTEYPFEVIIHDDCSTDNTSSILNEYLEKYPNIIKVIFNETNQYSKNVNLPVLNCNKVIKGKYVAFCEGDDFWIDSSKINSQVNFLESNHDFGMVISNYYSYHECNKTYNVDLKIPMNRLNFKEHLIHTEYFAPMTWLTRKNVWLEVTNYTDIYLDSTFIWMLKILLVSKVGVLNSSTAVYRILQESASHSEDGNIIYARNQSLYNSQLAMLEYSNSNDITKEELLFNNIIRNIDYLTIKKLSMDTKKKLLSEITLTIFKLLPLSKKYKLFFLLLAPNKMKFFLRKYVSRRSSNDI